MILLGLGWELGFQKGLALELQVYGLGPDEFSVEAFTAFNCEPWLLDIMIGTQGSVGLFFLCFLISWVGIQAFVPIMIFSSLLPCSTRRRPDCIEGLTYATKVPC